MKRRNLVLSQNFQCFLFWKMDVTSQETILQDWTNNLILFHTLKHCQADCLEFYVYIFVHKVKINDKHLQSVKNHSLLHFCFTDKSFIHHHHHHSSTGISIVTKSPSDKFSPTEIFFRPSLVWTKKLKLVSIKDGLREVNTSKTKITFVLRCYLVEK